MTERNEQVWVGLVGDIILARLRGPSTAALLKECHERIVNVVQDTGCTKVLYHMLELEPSPTDTIAVQKALDREIENMPLRRAILVPNALLAFRAGMGFGWDAQVLGDMDKAVEWLEQD
jgi:hypothetical protein